MKLDFDKVFKYIIENAELNKAFQYYTEHCNSLTLPYHNLNHTLGMIYHIICIYENSRRRDDYTFKLEIGDLHILILSALFHDFNHSGGRFSDEVNIHNAKEGLKSCLNSIYGESNEIKYLYSVCSLTIEATQYPYIIDNKDLSLYQRILRECDILVALYDDYITHRVYGLAEEMKCQDMIQLYAKEYEFIITAMRKMELVYSKELWRSESEKFLNTYNLFGKVLGFGKINN